jgi:TRAP-type C4-dicarboxylate transport system substrate-binding protein
MKLTLLRCAWKTAVAGILVACGVAAQPARAATTIVMNPLLAPQDAFNARVLVPWAKDVERATEGRVKIVFPPSSVAAPDQLWNSVTSGIVDAAYLFNGLIPNRVPLEQVAALPFVSGSAASTSLALWRTYQGYFAKSGEYKGVKLLALFAMPPGQIFSSKTAIVKPADLNGMRVWALPGVPQRILQGTRAGVISKPAAQLSELVAGGTVDAIAGLGEYNADGLKVLGYMKYATLVPGGLTVPGFSIIVNQSKWDSISAQDRSAIEKLSGEAFAKRLVLLDEFNASVRRDAERRGLKIVEPSPELVTELRKLSEPLFMQWQAAAKARGVDGAAALKYFEQQAKQTSP